MTSQDLVEAVQALPHGWHGHYLDVVDSTQDEARAAGERGAPDRSLFVADYQRAGRGRQGRRWLARPGAALMLSMLFREASAAAVPWRWTSLASVSLAQAISDVLPTLASAIKWPNDVMLDDRKVAGVLAQTWSDGQRLVAVVGVGVNVNANQSDLSRVGSPATSLCLAGKQEISRGRLLLAFVTRMDAWLGRPWPELHAAWNARLWGRGQRLRLLDINYEEDVVVLGAELDGSLRVRLADGTERRTTTGELLR
jgi:BirA family biotin operon repressor/biotin-[acetyl-CoA-carboxylase] ligase